MIAEAYPSAVTAVELLPRQVPLKKLIERQTHLSGVMTYGSVARLWDLLSVCDDTAEVAKADLTFRRDEHGYEVISGVTWVTLQLQCQRCLEMMDYPIETVFTLSPVTSDELAKKLPSRYDPLWWDGCMVDVAKLLEDEILLAVPNYPKHHHDCVTI